MRSGGMRAAGVGAVLLVTVFAVLCLGIFAALSLSMAKSELALADKSAASTQEYYAADSRAQELAAALTERLLQGDALPDTLDGVAVEPFGDGGTGCSFVLPCGTRQIRVSLSLEADGVTSRYRLLPDGDWAAEGDLNVWQGESGD